jgi:2-isopropylmalate synthase
MNTPETTPTIKLYDTTLRDGSQASDINFTLEEKLALVGEFDRFGLDYIEAGWPRPRSADAALYAQAAKLELAHAKLAAFASTKKARTAVEDDPIVRALVESGAPVATIFGKTWIHHVTYQLKATPEENLGMIAGTIRYLKDNPSKNFDEVIYDAEHFFDGYKDDADYALEALKTAALAGADVIVLCDTNGGTLFWEIGEIVRRVRDFLASDAELAALAKAPELGIHCHNDSGLAVANTLEAVRCGCTHVQGTVNGIGERIGNADLVQIIANLALKTDTKLDERVKTEALTRLSDAVYARAGLRPRKDQPFVGIKAFAHDGGVHVDAVIKGASYQHIDPVRVGNRMRITLSTNSGRASIYAVVKSLGYDVQPDDPRLKAMLDEVHALCGQGFDIGLLDDEHALMALRHLKGIPRDIVVTRCDVTSHFTQVDDDVDHDNSCVLKMEVDGKEYKVFEDTESGPVGVNFKAMKAALRRAGLPTNFHLVNYEVGLPKQRAGAGSTIQTYITYETEDGRLITTSGFHEDIIVSSRESLLKAALLVAARFGK